MIDSFVLDACSMPVHGQPYILAQLHKKASCKWMMNTNEGGNAAQEVLLFTHNNIRRKGNPSYGVCRNRRTTTLKSIAKQQYYKSVVREVQKQEMSFLAHNSLLKAQSGEKTVPAPKPLCCLNRLPPKGKARYLPHHGRGDCPQRPPANRKRSTSSHHRCARYGCRCRHCR